MQIETEVSFSRLSSQQGGYRRLGKLHNAIAGMARLERLAAGDSPVHRLHPMVKLAATVSYIVVVVSFPGHNVSGLVPFVLFPAVMMSLSGTPFRPLLQRLMLALPFTLLGGISNLIFERSVAVYIGGVAISLGCISFISILLKTLLSVLSVLLLVATTSFSAISRQLITLHIPKILCLQLIMTYRYLSVLMSEASLMFTAYTLRGSGQKGIGINDTGSFIGQLILRSFDRAGRIYQAMKCRGFSGVYYSESYGRFRLTDGIYIISLILLMVFLRFFNLSVFLGNLLG